MTDPTEHLSDIDIAGYLDRRLPAADVERVENHLAECAECRHQLSESQQILMRTRRPRRIAAAAGLLAAAAAVLIVVRVGQFGGRDIDSPMRGSDSSASLIAYAPLGETNQSAVHFVWASAKDAASYRLSLSGADGAQVWSYSGTDTTAILPASVVLKPGRRYFWAVDAILLEGTTRSTGMREFNLVE